MRLQQLDDSEETKNDDSSRFGSVSFLGESILENEKMENYNWAFEDVASINVDDPSVRIINFDCVNERCFILFSNLKLTEVNLESKTVV
mmetsp:Transcript_28432/g.37923  ORF Transcript_28432/g.37923 Transcript_28432/m.37923 type:complete len:89 (+) Transcript_28432:2002-2268(+)